MESCIMANKRLLGIGDQPEFLLTMKQWLLSVYSGCQFDMASRYEEGRQLILLLTYDLVICDILSAPGLELAGLIKDRKLPVLALMDHSASCDMPHHFKGINIRSVHPKKDINTIAPAVEKILKSESSTGWTWVGQTLCGLPNFLISSLATRGPERSFHIEKINLY